MDGSRTLRLMDRRRGRVDMREQVRSHRVTGLADMHHVARPLRVPFVAVPCLGIIWGFDALGGRRERAIGLEKHAHTRVLRTYPVT